MKCRLIYGGLLLAMASVSMTMGGCGYDESQEKTSGGAHQQYTCPMHPAVRLEDPKARCPICGMELVPLEGGTDSAMEIHFSPETVGRMNFQTFPVSRRELTKPIDLQGKLTYDETRLAKITAWVPGRVNRLYVDYTGMAIRKNEHMLELYSPELISAQEELLQALQAQKTLSPSASTLLRSSVNANAQAAREKLTLLGLSKDQIRGIVTGNAPTKTMTIRAPMAGIVTGIHARKGEYVKTGTLLFTLADLRHLWLMVDAYESDLPWIRYGQSVTFSTQARPGREFKGRIAFIAPALDPENHTLAIRVNVDNPDGALQPGMLVRAAILSQLDRSGKATDKALVGKWICPMHPGEIRDTPGACRICDMAMVPAEKTGLASPSATSTLPLVIPASAVLQTGKRAVVYVRNRKAPQPTYALRKVTLGPRAGAWYVVDKGLVAGEQVVVRGAFKIDSERQLRGLPSMMSLNDPAPAAATVSPTPTVHAPLPRAFGRILKDVLASYLSLQKALASDDNSAAHAATERLNKAIRNLPVRTLRATQQAVWKETAGDLAPLTKQALAADGLAAKREVFHALSKVMLGVVRVYGVPEGATLYLMHCPMAFGNTGASWLQRGHTLANPYFGAAMLRCGEQRQKFTPSEVAP